MIIDFQNNCIWYRSENFQQKTHTPFSTNFSKIEVLKDGRLLIMEDYYQYQFEDKSNLYCLNRELEIEWFVPIPKTYDSKDVYAGFTSNGDKIFANTYTGFRVEINISDGSIQNAEFVK